MIIFYDGICPLCHHAVRFVLRVDTKKQFQFASLQGKTAAERGIPTDLDSLVLIDRSGKTFYRGKAALRILWHLGGLYSLPGLLSFLPRWLIDPLYRLIAHYRYRLFRKGTLEPAKFPGRFLP